MINQFRSTLECHILVAPTGYLNSWNICAETSDAPDVDMINDLITKNPPHHQAEKRSQQLYNQHYDKNRKKEIIAHKYSDITCSDFPNHLLHRASEKKICAKYDRN